MSQIEYLTSMLYSQLGITQGILDGTADDRTKLNYDNRTIEPILSAIVDEMKRKFLTKTARSQKQSILFFRDPFRLVPINDIAEIADKMTRNEIMTSNEIRQKIGMKPSKDPKADELRNSNLSAPKEEAISHHQHLKEETFKMNLKYDFSGWATRNDLVCADGRTIRHNAFEDCDGKTVPLVWNHQHDEPGNILGHALWRTGRTAFTPTAHSTRPTPARRLRCWSSMGTSRPCPFTPMG